MRMELFNMKSLYRAESIRDLYYSLLLESLIYPNPVKLKLFILLDTV